LVDQYNRIRVSQRQGDLAASYYNVRFEGNPATGKTTITRHYSAFLQHLRILPAGSISLDVHAPTLVNKGGPYLEDMPENVRDTSDGVIFTDGAYQLENDIAGEKVIDFVLPLVDSLDSKYRRLVWIFAAYPSKFPHLFTFADYTASELRSIFHGLMTYKDKPKQKKKRQVPPGTISTLQSCNTLGRQRASYVSAHGEFYDDRFGTRWTCDINIDLIDEYGNSTGYHPKNIGFKTKFISLGSWTIMGAQWSIIDICK